MKLTAIVIESTKINTVIDFVEGHGVSPFFFERSKQGEGTITITMPRRFEKALLEVLHETV